jgi:general secretion pathway protein G
MRFHSEEFKMIRNHRPLESQQGFTLIELLVVMIIIGLLAALVVPKMFGKVGKAQRQATQAQIELFATALDVYRLDVGSYPTTEQGLAVLLQKPHGVERWDGPYLPKDIPMDPWQKPYLYRSPGDQGRPYELMSYGSDGAPGGEGDGKDIVSWKGLDQ